MAEKNCCGKKIESLFCPHCGKKVIENGGTWEGLLSHLKLRHASTSKGVKPFLNSNSQTAIKLRAIDTKWGRWVALVEKHISEMENLNEEE